MKTKIGIFGIIRKFTLAILFAGCIMQAFADAYTDYIERYADMAIEQQEAYGIPASITLAQGLLESAAGRSTLASEGNNHFGIKCHSTWTGATMLRDDDAPDECFRVYDSPLQSFIDHSKFLQGRRYKPLFELDPSDYEAWARGLKECGYATDPKYAERLITIIERYTLYNYDTDAGRAAENTALFILESLQQRHPVLRARGLHYVIANPGDRYSDIARELGCDTERLLRFNDAAADGEIKAWEEVYLQEKLEHAPKGIKKATIGEGESIHSVAQRFGIKESVVRELNPGALDLPGTTLKLK